jgi:propionyl-CoA synthetase
MSYKTEYQASIDNPEKFWGEKSALIDWFKAPENILSTDEHGIQQCRW